MGRGNQKRDREGKAGKKERIIKPVILTWAARARPYWRTQVDGGEDGSVIPTEG